MSETMLCTGLGCCAQYPGSHSQSYLLWSCGVQGPQGTFLCVCFFIKHFFELAFLVSYTRYVKLFSYSTFVHCGSTCTSPMLGFHLMGVRHIILLKFTSCLYTSKHQKVPKKITGWESLRAHFCEHFRHTVTQDTVWM